MTSVDDVIARMQSIASALEPTDGAAVFNRVYLEVTAMVRDRLAAGTAFTDDAFMADLDVRFAQLWFRAYDASPASRSRAWSPLFESRRRDLAPIQFALAGMNAHIEHDLPLAVVATCRSHGRRPDDVRADYEKVNDLLAEVESGIRRSFLDDLGRALDDEVGPLAHLIAAWDIGKAREAAWVSVCLLWELRDNPFLDLLQRTAIDRTVGLGSRLLLTPVT